MKRCELVGYACVGAGVVYASAISAYDNHSRVN